MNDATIFKHGVGIRFETYLTTEEVRDRIIEDAKYTRVKGSSWDGDDEGSDVRIAHIIRSSSKPVELTTQTSDEPVKLYLTTVGWSESKFFQSDGPYKKYDRYSISSYH